MKKIVIAVLMSAAGVWAQDHAQFDAWMKSIDTTMKTLQKMEPKTGPQVVSAGERFGAIYEQMIHFWKERGLGDAVKISMDGKAAANQLATAAYAGNAQEAAAAFKAFGATCRACHTKYRVKRPDGSSTFPPLYQERKRQ